MKALNLPDPIILRVERSSSVWTVNAPDRGAIRLNGLDPIYMAAWDIRLDGWLRVLVSAAMFDDGVEYFHVSCSRRERMPSYSDLCYIRDRFVGDRYAYQVFPPKSAHVNIHPNCLHLWGRLDGAPSMPEFGAGGTI
jgi:hypothetical protein